MLQLFFKDLFFSALDYAGTYGVLVLFGVVPAAMTWQASPSAPPEQWHGDMYGCCSGICILVDQPDKVLVAMLLA